MTIELLKRAVEVGGETALVLLFSSDAYSGKPFEDRIQFDPAIDTLVCAVDLVYGRADILITHADRSITVIVARDGARGREHVTAGIGMASLCADQLAMLRPSVEVRKALLWASTGDPLLDGMLDSACTAGGVISLSWSTMEQHLAETAKCLNRGLASAEHLADVHLDAKGIH